MALSVLASSPSISWPRRMIVSNNMSHNINNNVREGFVSSPNNGIYKSQRSLQNLTVASVASRPTSPLPAPPQPLAEGHQQHGAWRHGLVSVKRDGRGSWLFKEKYPCGW
ncbi:hypothetical protein PIB30_091959 [Stylosanthes scabra]|uniref:Uncharacterized protein n=1 Tax=Stylosanthes scabra TaxID=79078 RepID=A0ABU6QU43_9FABA|nr:hypothetical protein [Stylosanthes scabra]